MGYEIKFNGLPMLSVDRVRAVCSIFPCPADRAGRVISRGEIGHIQDEADGFLFVEFGDEIAMCDMSEVRPA